MNSKERHEARYQRRKAKRLAKRMERTRKHSNLNDIFSESALYESYKFCKNGTDWKAIVQRYGVFISTNLPNLIVECYSGSFTPRGFHCFDIKERGKLRHIKSITIEERVVQKSFVKNCITPVLRPYLIYDNGATLKGRGPHHQIKRVVKHLQDHYKKYGLKGWIYTFDFHDYFGSIPLHALVEAERSKLIFDHVMKYVETFIYAFGKIGLGLGSEISQISAVYYPNPIDHYIKDQMRVHGYDRYMDDGIIIHHSKKYLVKVIQGVKQIAEKLGLSFSEKKCRLQKISKQFTFLKTRFRLTETGKVVKRVVNKTITRERRRLKKFRHLLDISKMTFDQILNAYKSWKGSIKHRGMCYTSIKNLDKLFDELFINPFIDGRDYCTYTASPRSICFYLPKNFIIKIYK